MRKHMRGVPRKSGRVDTAAKRRNIVTGTIHKTDIVRAPFQNVVMADFRIALHTGSAAAQPIRYQGPSFSSVGPSGKTAGREAMLPKP